MIFVVDATWRRWWGCRTPEHAAGLRVHDDRRGAGQRRVEPVCEQLPADEHTVSGATGFAWRRTRRRLRMDERLTRLRRAEAIGVAV